MLLPTWNPGFCVGHAEIDEQHKMLISIGRQLERLAAAPDNAVVRSIFRATLNDVLELALKHFDTEEALLAANGYPSLAGHRARHRELLQTLKALLRRGGPNDLDRAEVARGVAEHIVAEHFEGDLPCRIYLQAREAVRPAA